jgi:ATP-dependent helicase HrpA
MAGELVETTRLWARTVARIQPGWAEQLAGHLVTRSYGDPHWSAKRGSAVAAETVRLYGVPLATDRIVDYGPVDAEVARDLFIRHALVNGDWRTQHAFWRRNRTLIARAEALEDKLRRDVLVDDDTLFAFYDAIVGDDVTSTRHFDGWWRRAFY